MSKKLAAKASLIQLPPAAVPERGEPAESKPKTAPGSMAHFMAAQSAAVREADELRERLEAFDGAKPVRALDPRTVRPSRWANRHADSLADAAFAALKAEIASAGGNVQPVKVRPVAAAPAAGNPASGAGSGGQGAGSGGAAFELVFGHRRHRACLELGLPVNALIEAVSDRELFEAMDRENRGRKSLSAWEQGMTYRRALDEGLYPSQRRLAESLGVDVALVSKSLTLARLPGSVVGAFASPNDIQFRWAQPLADALQKDPDGMLARAEALRGAAGPQAASLVFAALIGAPGVQVLNRSTPQKRVIRGPAGRQASLVRDVQGRVVVRISAHAIDDAGFDRLGATLEALFAGG